MVKLNSTQPWAAGKIPSSIEVEAAYQGVGRAKQGLNRHGRHAADMFDGQVFDTVLRAIVHYRGSILRLVSFARTVASKDFRRRIARDTQRCRTWGEGLAEICVANSLPYRN